MKIQNPNLLFSLLCVSCGLLLCVCVSIVGRTVWAFPASQLTVDITPIADGFLELQRTKTFYISAINAQPGNVIKCSDLTPILCMVTIRNPSTKTISVPCPQLDTLGIFSICLEFVVDGRTVVARRSKDANRWLSARLSGSGVCSRSRRLIPPGQSLAIPIRLDEYTPDDLLKDMCIRDARGKVRAIYRYYGVDESHVVEIPSPYVDMKTLFLNRTDMTQGQFEYTYVTTNLSIGKPARAPVSTNST